MLSAFTVASWGLLRNAAQGNVPGLGRSHKVEEEKDPTASGCGALRLRSPYTAARFRPLSFPSRPGTEKRGRKGVGRREAVCSSFAT